MNFKLYAAIFTGLLALFVVLGVGVQWHIKTQIAKGVETELALKAIEKQNEAIRENALWQEEIESHNESQSKRYNALVDKYDKILKQNASLKGEKSSCERELAQLKGLLGAFYDSNASR